LGWTNGAGVRIVHYVLNDGNVLNVSDAATLPAIQSPHVNPNTRQFIERVGVHSEADGLPRIAGRIFGLLLITPAECSLDDMAETLGVSKASISTDARRLEQLGIVVRTSRPGDRRDYYSIGRNALRQSLEHRIRSMRQFQELLRDARSLPDATDEVRDRLDEWDAWYESALELVETLLARAPAKPAAAASRRR
jgi:DNA-binding transcriptional regulator GbsR (MarR family)